MQVGLSRRSDFSPRRMTGVVGQKWRTSGYHCLPLAAYQLMRQDNDSHTLSIILSSELGQSIAKQTSKRSVSGYESGLSRSYSS